MSVRKLTVLIITRDEEANIGRTLRSIHWAQNILVIDSYSTDRTLELVRRHPGSRVIQREFSSFADQCNFGLSQINTEWVLSIDADYVFPGGADTAIEKAMESSIAGFDAAFEYCILGRPVRGSILPPRTVLYRRPGARYVNDGHGHRVVVEGTTATLPFKISHDDRKPLSRWLSSQITYAQREADKISQSDFKSLGFNDRIRKAIVLSPCLVFLLVYVFRGGFMSGWRGLFYAGQRFTAELLLSLFLVANRVALSDKPGDHSRTDE